MSGCLARGQFVTFFLLYDSVSQVVLVDNLGKVGSGNKIDATILIILWRGEIRVFYES